jgi:hypothetical protein
MIVNPPGQPTYGTADHAALITHGRHPGVQTALAWLAFSHLAAPLQPFSRPFFVAAVELINSIPNDSAELVTALNRLVDAKDSAVRAGIRSDQGRPGPVPRSAAVVDAPAFTTAPIVDPPKPGTPGTSTWSNAAGSTTTADLPPFGPQA